MYSLRELKDLSILSDDDFKSSLQLIYPSNRINLKILLEIERRNIRNDSKILKYLLELRRLKIQPWSVERLLLSLYDLNHPSIRFRDPPYVFESLSNLIDFKVNEVIKSIKSKKIDFDFINFIKFLENLIFNLNMADKKNKEKILLENKKLLVKLIIIIYKISNKGGDKILSLFSSGKFNFKETWLFALKYKNVGNLILFIILINLPECKDYNFQVLEKSLRERVFKNDNNLDYKEYYKVINDMYRRYNQNEEDKNEDIKVPEVVIHEEIKTFSFKIKKSQKTQDEKSLEWYKARTEN
ncbi:uncharacterized protein VNE69_07250 [Vairimorpha necatrix]|uniref:Uncharacterized protein n=1 Tax=Vairimorpha necatrix TaxID=6039 RepID=A0AAX4JDW4_9MICR